jgi:hypothetical protein
VEIQVQVAGLDNTNIGEVVVMVNVVAPLSVTAIAFHSWCYGETKCQVAVNYSRPISVATAIAGVFANFTNKIGKMTDKLENVDKAKSRGIFCQH